MHVEGWEYYSKRPRMSQKQGKVQRLAFRGDVLPDNGANGTRGAQKHEAGEVARRGAKITASRRRFMEP
jgi:hypothetical protein